jgi:hypothetical protein
VTLDVRLVRAATSSAGREYTAAAAAHRATLARLAERGNIAPLRALYDDAVGALTSRLRASVRAGEEFGAHVQRVALAQAREGVEQLSPRLAAGALRGGQQAAEDSLHGLAGTIRRFAPQFRDAAAPLAIEEAARFRGVTGGVTSQLRRRLADGFVRYTTSTVDAVERRLALGVATRETSGSVIDGVQNVIGGEWYRAERIVRTETAWSFNASHAAGIAEASREIDGLMMRWSEFVDDESYAPLDDRVGVDSVAMHGQVAPAGGVFTMPPTTYDGEPVSAALAGEAWEFPPNRPNDRAVLTPWHADWGVPGWRYEAGARVPTGSTSAE